LRKGERRDVYSRQGNHGGWGNQGHRVNKCNGSSRRERRKVFGQRVYFIRKRRERRELI